MAGPTTTPPPPPRSVRAAETLVLVQAGCALAMAVLVLQIAGLGRDVALAAIAALVALWLVTGAALWAMAAVELDHLSNSVRRTVLAVEAVSALFLAVRGGWLRPLVVLPLAVAALLMAPSAVHAFVPVSRRRAAGRPRRLAG